MSKKLILVALLLVASALPVSASAADTDVCDGIDKELLMKHIPFLFDRIVEKRPIAQYGLCQVIIYVQQGPHQGGYFDEIAIDAINLQPGDEKIVAARLREELTRR